MITMKCKSCDSLLLDDDDIELCSKCIKQGDKLTGTDLEGVDVYYDDDSVLEDNLEIEPYTEIIESDYILME